MRRLLSAVLGVLSVLALPIALLALWASLTLTRADVFVDETGPLIATRPVQDALTEAVVGGIVSQLHVEAPVAKLIEPPLREAASRVIASPQTATAWKSSMRSLHRELVSVLEGRAPTRVDKQGHVLITVPIALPVLGQTLTAFGVPVSPNLTAVATIPVATVDQLQWARTGYSFLSTVGPWGPLAVVALAALAVALAMRRRGAAQLILSGWAVAAVALGLALIAARQPAVDQVQDPTVRALANTAYGVAQRGVLLEVGVVVGVCLVALIVIGVTRVVSRRRHEV